MKRIFFAILFIIVAFPAFTKEKPEKNKIDTGITYQTIDNFSASDAWRSDFIGKYWPEEKKNKLANKEVNAIIRIQAGKLTKKKSPKLTLTL